MGPTKILMPVSVYCEIYTFSMKGPMIHIEFSPTATLLERTLPAQGFMGTSKAAFPRRL
jgi:hypothetical protein